MINPSWKGAPFGSDLFCDLEEVLSEQVHDAVRETLALRRLERVLDEMLTKLGEYEVEATSRSERKG